MLVSKMVKFILYFQDYTIILHQDTFFLHNRADPIISHLQNFPGTETAAGPSPDSTL